MRQHGGAGAVSLARAEFVDLMHFQPFSQGHAGRYYVALSLREAESVRAAIHLSMDQGVPMVSGGHTAVALRLADGETIGAVGGGGGRTHFTSAPRQQLASAVAAYQFIDSQHRYTPWQCRLLLRMLRHDVRASGQDDRRRWFLDVRRCRRRMQGRIDQMRRGGVEQVSAAVQAPAAHPPPTHTARPAARLGATPRVTSRR